MRTSERTPRTFPTLVETSFRLVLDVAEVLFVGWYRQPQSTSSWEPQLLPTRAD